MNNPVCPYCLADALVVQHAGSLMSAHLHSHTKVLLCRKCRQACTAFYRLTAIETVGQEKETTFVETPAPILEPPLRRIRLPDKPP